MEELDRVAELVDDVADLEDGQAHYRMMMMDIFAIESMLIFLC